MTSPKVRKAEAAARYEKARCTLIFPQRHTEEDLADARAVFEEQKAKHLKHLKGLSKEQKEQLCHTIVDERYLAVMQALAAPIPQGDARPA